MQFRGVYQIMIIFSLFSSTCFGREFYFKFELPPDEPTRVLEYSVQADFWDEAYKKAAQFCLDTLIHERPLTEERILQITDICANPR